MSRLAHLPVSFIQPRRNCAILQLPTACHGCPYLDHPSTQLSNMTMDIEPPQASTSAATMTAGGSMHKTSRRLVQPVARGMLSRTT